MIRNLAEEVENRADGELIEAAAWEGHLETWDRARPFFDREIDDDWGIPDELRCPNVMAWSPSWVIFVLDYDTARSIARLPRQPTTVHGESSVLGER